ncbi:MAG: response regulator transcription factor [Bacteroidetes bacterium]|nr:response regulator transcription factor [Bacteroidota bacterium]
MEPVNDAIRLLVVEDDPNLRMLLHDYLELMKFSVETAADGAQGLQLALNGQYDLYVLDVMLPKMDGFSLAGKIRENDPGTPIIFLTAKTMQEDRITGFMQGCDDYITKPFNTDELYARIRAILRRCNRKKFKSQAEESQITFGVFTFDFDNLLLSSPGAKRTLTRKEAALLRLLCNNRNQLVLRETAQKVVWGESDYFVSRSMDVFIARLRKYLKEDPTVTIANVYGMGFILKVDDTQYKQD